MKHLFGVIIIGATAFQTPFHRDTELNVASHDQKCEVTIISSHYDKEGNLHEVMEMDNGIIRQFMYKPVGFVPVGTGDDDYE